MQSRDASSGQPEKKRRRIVIGEQITWILMNAPHTAIGSSRKRTFQILLFGRCRNKDEPRLPYQMDCAVGSVRKLRRGMSEDEDDCKCGTCPYFERHPTIGQAIERFGERRN